MSASFAWVCSYILDQGHFSFPDADADLGTTELSLTQQMPNFLYKEWQIMSSLHLVFVTLHGQVTISIEQEE